MCSDLYYTDADLIYNRHVSNQSIWTTFGKYKYARNVKSLLFNSY